MITRFRVQNYKALRDVSVELTPIHVLIGPNDSGKTSILEAIAALCRSVDRQLCNAFTGSWEGTQLVWHGGRDLSVSMAARIEHDLKTFDYELKLAFGSVNRAVQLVSENVKLSSDAVPMEIGAKGHSFSASARLCVHNEQLDGEVRERAHLVGEALAGVHSYRWDARFLALPVAPDSKRSFRMDPSGFGLALCLDDILGSDRGRFDKLESRFKEIFPQFKSIMLKPEAAFKSPVDDPTEIPMLHRSEGKGIYFKLSTGEQISASQVSDGVLLVLAYLTILNLPEPPHMLLVEEPENGIHPKRLGDVLSILRNLVSEQTHTQVVMTTHSPYVLDMFEPKEVTLCQKQPDGSVKVQRLSESRAVREQLDVFSLGEIWTAEGDEAIAEPELSAAGKT